MRKTWFSLGLLLAVTSGCASFRLAPSRIPENAVSDSHAKSPKEAHSGTIRPEVFVALENILQRTKDREFVLKRNLLEEILQGEETYKNRTVRLNDQLEALKSIDTAETEKSPR